MKHVLLGVLALLALLRISGAAVQGAGNEPTPSAEETLRECRQTLRRLDRISAALEREPLSPGEFVDEVGEDADELTRWIADSVEWLPYRGVLSGPRGVLIGRQGNGLDQCLLLAAACRELELEVRLANARLPLEVASELHGALRGALDEAEERSAPAPPSVIDFEAHARSLGMDAAALRSAYEAQKVQGQRYLEYVLPTTVERARDLKALLEAKGIVAADEALREIEVESLGDHWWVQVSGDGREWTDHDPLAVRAGMTLEVTPEALHATDDLPADLLHRLTVRVVAERSDPSGLHTAVALSHEAQARDLAGIHFVLGFQPLNFDPAGGATQDGDAMRTVAGLAAEESEWLPSFAALDPIGPPVEVSEASIRTDGTLDPDPQLDPKVRAVARASSLLGSGVGDPLRADSHLTAVWIEYEIAGPGSEPEVVRRNVFDLLGEARRRSAEQEPLHVGADQAVERGLALLGTTQILPLTGRLSGDFVVRTVLAMQLGNQRALVSRAEAIVDGRETGFDGVAASFTTPPLELLMLGQMRMGVGRHVDRVHLGSVNVLSNHVELLLPEEGGESALTLSHAIDVVTNPVDVLAPRYGVEGAVSAWDIRLEQGVLDTVLEVVSVMGLDEGGPPLDDRTRATNPVLWMDRHPAGEWMGVAAGDELSTAAGDTGARVLQAFEGGHVAVLPSVSLVGADGGWKPGCWWKVDPRTGRTLGIGPRGWGEGFVGRIATSATWRSAMAGLRKYAANRACFIGVVVARLSFSAGMAMIGQELGGDSSELLSILLAALAQAGYTGEVYRFMEASCRVIMGG